MKLSGEIHEIFRAFGKMGGRPIDHNSHRQQKIRDRERSAMRSTIIRAARRVSKRSATSADMADVEAAVSKQQEGGK